MFKIILPWQIRMIIDTAIIVTPFVYLTCSSCLNQTIQLHTFSSTLKTKDVLLVEEVQIL